MLNRRMVLITTRWCNPCKHLKKTLVPEVEADCPGQIKVVDGEADPERHALKYKITKVPTILLFEGDDMVKMFSGIMPQAGLLVNWLKGGDLHGADGRDR